MHGEISTYSTSRGSCYNPLLVLQFLAKPDTIHDNHFSTFNGVKEKEPRCDNNIGLDLEKFLGEDEE